MSLYCFLDTETTGFDSLRNQVISLAAYITDPDYNLLGEFSTGIRPVGSKDVVWSLQAEDVHGITWHEAREFPELPEVHELLVNFLNPWKRELVMVAHNMPFDRRMIKGTWSRIEKHNEILSYYRDFQCTLSMSRKSGLLPKKMTRLNHICEHLGIELDHHDAKSDAKALISLHRFLTTNGQDNAILINQMGIEFDPKEEQECLL